MRLLLALALVACANGEAPRKQVEGTPCSDLLPHFRTAVLAVEPNAGLLAERAMPTVLAACLADQWPETLRRCIVTSTANELVNHACDKLVSDEIAQKLLDRLAPGQRLSPRDFLRR